MKFAEYRIIAVNTDGSPVCECGKCHQPARVQYQKPLTPKHQPLYYVDCDSGCEYHMRTLTIRAGDVKLDGIIEK